MSAERAMRVTSDGRAAPELRVLFRCPECGALLTADAYRGPLTCSGRFAMEPPESHRPTFMVAETLANNTEET